jgi:hypothetical protein
MVQPGGDHVTAGPDLALADDADGLHEVRGARRLDQYSAGARVESAPGEAIVLVSGHQDHRRISFTPDRGAEAEGAVHAAVHEQDLGLAGAQSGAERGPIVLTHDRERGSSREDAHQPLAEQPVIADDGRPDYRHALPPLRTFPRGGARQSVIIIINYWRETVIYENGGIVSTGFNILF